ncbi:Prefoldin [Lipomyces japonicus]|uniref:Prefoldin n=1 Tax=Lipomyces japonicus TaxID=56871 RepID=UPI0034CE156A
MSIPPEALQKVLQEIELRVMQSQMELSSVQQQISQKQRDIRMTDLTIKELKDISSDVGVWEGVGKMFLNVPITSHVDKLLKERKEGEDQITALSKKLHYLETTYKNAKQSIDEIVGNSRS